MYVRACVHLPVFVRAINSTFRHEFQTKLGTVVLLEEKQCHLKQLFRQDRCQGHTWRSNDKMFFTNSFRFMCVRCACVCLNLSGP